MWGVRERERDFTHPQQSSPRPRGARAVRGFPRDCRKHNFGVKMTPITNEAPGSAITDNEIKLSIQEKYLTAGE
jgi:hypothetical protein